MSNRRIELDSHVADFISEVKQRCPEASIEVSYQPYETEDAHLTVRPPESWTLAQCEELSEEAARLVTDLLLDTGLSILILIVEPQKSVRQEREAYLEARRQKAS